MFIKWLIESLLFDWGCSRIDLFLCAQNKSYAYQATQDVKNRQIHVEKHQECHVLEIKKSSVKNNPEKNPTSKINQDLVYWGIGGGYWVKKKLINY